MSITTSPKVIINEVDYSRYVAGSSGLSVGIVGPARKGKLGPKLYSSQKELIESLGTPLEGDHSLYAAFQALKKCNQVYYCRVVHRDALGETVAAKAVAGNSTPTSFNPGAKAFMNLNVFEGVEEDGSYELGMQSGSVRIGEVTLSYSTNPNGTTTFEDSASFIALFSSNTYLKANFNIQVTNTETVSVGGDTVTNNMVRVESKTPGVDGNTIRFSSTVPGISSQDGFHGGADPVAVGVDKIVLETENYDSTMNGKQVAIVQDPLNRSVFVISIFSMVSGARVLDTTYRISVDVKSEIFYEKVLSKSISGLVLTYNRYGGNPLPTSSNPLIFSGGNDGSAGLTASDIVGYSEQEGIKALSNPEEYEIKAIAAPGWHDETVLHALVDVAEGNMSCEAYIDLPSGLTPLQANAWINGSSGEMDYVINSSKAFVLPVWLKYYDSFKGITEFKPALGEFFANLSVSYANNKPWQVPAGLERGVFEDALDVETVYSEADRDIVYTGTNILNPIVKFIGQGIVLWGQKTGLRDFSVLDRLGPRLLLNEIERNIAVSTRYYIFTDNVEKSWDRWVMMVEPYLETLKQDGGLYDYEVVMDSTTVSNSDIDNYRMPGKVYLQLMKQGEVIPIDFILTPTGADFSSY